MLGGYMGKILWVNMTDKTLREEIPDEQMLSMFIGGYDIGARLLYNLISPKADALGIADITKDLWKVEVHP